MSSYESQDEYQVMEDIDKEFKELGISPLVENLEDLEKLNKNCQESEFAGRYVSDES